MNEHQKKAKKKKEYKVMSLEKIASACVRGRLNND